MPPNKQELEKQAKRLRERTQAGMRDCINALLEAQGDEELAVDIILKKSVAKYAIPF